MGRSECNHYIGIGTQGAGVAAFVTTVLGYTLVHKMLSAPWCRPSSPSSTPRGLRNMATPPPPALAASSKPSASGPPPLPPTNLPYRVGLLDLTVPSKRTSSSSSSGSSYTNLLLANDICIERAVQSVSDTLYIYLREDPAAVAAAAAAAAASSSLSLPPTESASLSPTTPELRVYLSELYGQLWDVCYLHKNLPLDVRILYNTTEPASAFSSSSSSSTAAAAVDADAAAIATAESGKSKGKGSSSSSKKKKDATKTTTPPLAASSSSSSSSASLQRQGNIPTSWEEALLKPELQVVFTQHKNVAADTEELSNAKREALGLPRVQIEWLDDAVRVALATPFYYLEDERSLIPHFPRVAVGGTFDRLHNGHKKLLTLAACVCQAQLTIGITSTEMLAKKKNAKQIEPLNDRIEAVRTFLHSVFPNLALDIVVLKDPFGPPVHKEDFDAIVVSSETIAGAAKINEIRAEKGFRPLVVVVTRRTVSSLLSSTFIRNNLPPRRNPGGK